MGRRKSIQEQFAELKKSGEEPVVQEPLVPNEEIPAIGMGAIPLEDIHVIKADCACMDVGSLEDMPHGELTVDKSCACKSAPKFETIAKMEAFMPEKSERDGYLLRIRAVKNMTGHIAPSYVFERGQQVTIFTGVKYNDVFKRPHFIKELPELTQKHECYVGMNGYDYNGELAIHMYLNGNKIALRHGNPVAELTVL